MRSSARNLFVLVLCTVALFGLALTVRAAGRDPGAPAADLVLVAGSAAPAEVVQTEPASFKVRVRNDGALALTLAASSAFGFTDAAGLSYTATLSDTTTIDPGAEAALQFALVAIPPDAQPGAYPFTLALTGEDAAGAPFDAMLVSADPVTVWPDASQLALVPGSMMPTRPDRYSELLYWMDFDNSGACALALDPARSRLILSGPTVNWRDVPLHEAATLAAGQRGRVYSAKFLQYGIPDGLYTPGFKLFGTNACDGTPFSAFVAAGAASDFGWEGSDEPVGIGCTGGSYFSFNQFGGVSQELGFSIHVHGDRQHLLEQELSCQWDGCQALLDADLIRMGKGPFGYYNSAVNPYYWSPLEFRSTASIPRGADNLLIVRHYSLSAQYCQGCVGIKMGCRWDAHVSVVDRAVEAGVTAVTPADTFLPRGGTAAVAVAVRNGEQLTANQDDEFFYRTTGDYTVEEESRLELTGPAAEQEGAFVSTLLDVGHTIPFSITHGVRFELAAAADAPLGPARAAPALTTTGEYRGWAGPHTLQGVTEEDELSARLHVVDRLPLEIVAGSANPDRMRPFGPPPPLTVTLRNVSDWPFTLAPTRTLTLPVRLVNPLYLALGLPNIYSSAQGSTVTAAMQTIRPQRDFLLGKISFDFCDGGGAPPPARIKLARPRPERVGVGAVIASFDLPEYAPGAPMVLDSPPFNVWLEKGQEYQVVIEAPGSGLCLPYQCPDMYPDGGFQLLMPNGWNPYSIGDLVMRFYADAVRYDATAVAEAATELAPGASVDLAFPASEWSKAIAPGVYTPGVRLTGEYDDGTGPADFVQTIHGADAPVLSPETGPVSIELADGGVSLRWVEPGAPAYYYDVWRSPNPTFTPGDPGALQINGTQWASALPGAVARFVDVYEPVLWPDMASFYFVRAVNGDYSYSPISAVNQGVVNFALVK